MCTFPGLLFGKDKVDARDSRPLTYPGKLLQASHIKDSKSFWKSSDLIKSARTDFAIQMAGKAMLVVEDFDEGALPVSIDDERTSGPSIQGAKKFEQLGSDAWVKVLKALFGGMTDELNNNRRCAIIIMDLSPGVGDLYQDWFKKALCDLALQLFWFDC
jgi:hypothetical protein